ncbi:MAG TPA: 5-(carboxyamino)imidazole ribonucleotide synthase [Blastocatellia bacterium]|nr:5-(carboxyamino)imidazole ribonucleotide synthase [Blastocatellia bacterium]
MNQAPILPGSTIGVLGSGQLGRMFAIAARRMGYRVHTFSPDSDTPTGQVADHEVEASYDDLDAVREFARGVSVVTFEFENVLSATAEAAAEYSLVRPSGAVLHTTQNRLREKTFLSKNGFPVAPFKHVVSLDNLRAALGEIGCPAVLKTAGFGYDGKGQSKINSLDKADQAWQSLNGQEAVLEAFIDFECEVSVVAARGLDGAFVHYGVIANTHRNHILDVSIAPAPVAPEIAHEAVDIARGVLESLDVIGVMCVEFFLTRSGKLLINELAPRPHNSGHFTFDACITSQFEQQLRAVCGLPLGSTELLRPAAMANLLGDLWQNGEPNWAAACALPEVKLHLYGKLEARPGRKMGHLTALASSGEEAARLVRSAREALCTKLNVVSESPG